MSLSDAIIALSILVFPLVLHFNLLFGSALLEKVKTPFPWFDEFYNRYPWALGVSAGASFAIAYLARDQRPVLFVSAAVGLIIFVVDAAAAGFSFYWWIYKSKRRNRRR